VVVNFPFSEERHGDVRVRTFSGEVDPEELAWHRDAEDRFVRVVEASQWYFQSDDALPKEMRPGDVYFIPKETWHRVIRRGNERLVVEIATHPTAHQTQK